MTKFKYIMAQPLTRNEGLNHVLTKEAKIKIFTFLLIPTVSQEPLLLLNKDCFPAKILKHE